MEDRSRPDVRSWPVAGGYHGHFRKPGGSWQFVRAADNKTAAVFKTSEAAKDAARDLVFEFMCPPIRSSVEREAVDPIGQTLAAEAAAFPHRRDATRAIERRTVFCGLGKGSVAVETVKRRGA